MSNEKNLQILGVLVILAGTIFKIMHIPYANAFLLFGLAGIIVMQSFYIQKMRKRIDDLENGNKQ